MVGFLLSHLAGSKSVSVRPPARPDTMTNTAHEAIASSSCETQCSLSNAFAMVKPTSAHPTTASQWNQPTTTHVAGRVCQYEWLSVVCRKVPVLHLFAHLMHYSGLRPIRVVRIPRINHIYPQNEHFHNIKLWLHVQFIACKNCTCSHKLCK